MKDFIYQGSVTVYYGAGQSDAIVTEIGKLTDHVLIVATGSFAANGHLAELQEKLQKSGISSTVLGRIKTPLLSKVLEGIRLARKNQVGAVIGIGGGVAMDIAKTVAFAVPNDETLLEKYLTYELSPQGLPHLPLITIPTNPMSGSETNGDVQLTLDQNHMQVGCAFYPAVFTWLNPEYVMGLPEKVLVAGQITAFSQLTCNYLNLTRGMLAEKLSEGTMRTIIECLRVSLRDPADQDARGNLMIASAIGLSGILDFGRQADFVPYPLQSFAQIYLGLNYSQASPILTPYWIKHIYRASDDKSIFRQYFKEVLGTDTIGLDDEAALQAGLSSMLALYREFGVAGSYGELTANPNDHDRLCGIIDAFGTMQSQFMELDTEKLAEIIEDAIIGNIN